MYRFNFLIKSHREKNFVIRGTPEAVERAKAMIMEKIGMPVTASTYGSYGGSSSGGGMFYCNWYGLEFGIPSTKVTFIK